EPGRFLVAQAGVLITQVRSVKQMGSRHFVLVDAGFNDLMRPAMYNALVQAKTALENSTLDTTLMELVYLRVSQINGCAFCLEMHSKALR
ncbi:hypothetical protein Q604_UNBC13184G0001, partial [human gut metagenome]